MREVGWGSVVLSGCLLVYALSMTTTVSTGLGEVHNIGLIDRKQSLLMVAIAGLMIGTGLLIAQAFLDKRSAIGLTPTSNTGGAPATNAQGASCAYCGSFVELPMEPCSAFSVEELRGAPESIDDDECQAALVRAQVFGKPADSRNEGGTK